MRKHYPICNCTGDFFDECTLLVGFNNKLGFSGRKMCERCGLFPWWTTDNNEQM